MSANFTVLDSFINEFRQTYNLEEVTYDEGLVGI